MILIEDLTGTYICRHDVLATFTTYIQGPIYWDIYCWEPALRQQVNMSALEKAVHQEDDAVDTKESSVESLIAIDKDVERRTLRKRHIHSQR